MTVGRALYVVNHEVKAIDQTRKYIKCLLCGNVPVHIPLVTVDIIAMRYGHIYLYAEDKWEPDQWDVLQEQSITVQGPNYNIATEDLKKILNTLTNKRREYYRLKALVISYSQEKEIKNIQLVNGIPMALVKLDGYYFHDFLKECNYNNIPNVKYYQPNYSRVTAVSARELEEALVTITNYLAEGGERNE